VLLKLGVPPGAVVAGRELLRQDVPAFADASRQPLEVGQVSRQTASVPLDHQQSQVVAAFLSSPADGAGEEVTNVQR
jgi:hypothetical protein